MTISQSGGCVLASTRWLGLCCPLTRKYKVDTSTAVPARGFRLERTRLQFPAIFAVEFTLQRERSVSAEDGTRLSANRSSDPQTRPVVRS